MTRYVIHRYAITFALILLLMITEVWAQWQMAEESQSGFLEIQRVQSIQFSFVLLVIVALVAINAVNLRATVRDLRASEEKFRALAENTQAIVAVIQDNQFLYTNPVLETITGYSHDEFRQTSPFDLIHPDHADFLRARLQASKNGETVSGRFEIKVRHKDGSARWLDVASSLLPLNGKMTYVVTALDVTSRKHIETNIQESQKFIARITEMIPDWIHVFDLNRGRYIYSNRDSILDLGYTAEDFEIISLGIPVHLYHPDEVDANARWFAKIYEAADGEVVPGEYRLKAKNDEWRWISTRNTIFSRNPDGTPHQILGVSRDITDHKNAEEHARYNENRFRNLWAESQRQSQELKLLAEVRNVTSRETEPQSLIRQVVEAVADIFGYQLVSIYLPDGDRLKLQHQVGHSHMPADMPVTTGVMGRVAASGQPVLIKDTKIDPDFTEAVPGIASEICVPLMDEGRVIGILNVESFGDSWLSEDDLRLVIAVSQFVSIALSRARLYAALAQERTLLRTMIDSIPSHIFYLDTNCRYILNNIADVRFNGAASVEAMAGKTVYDFFPEGLADEFHADNLRVLESGQPILDNEKLIRASGGGQRWLATSKLPLRDASGKVIGLVGISHDITERKRMELAEREQRALAEAFRDIASALTQTLNLDEVLDLVIANIERVVPHDAASIVLVDGERIRFVRYKGESIFPDYPDFPGKRSYTLKEFATLSAIADSGQPLVIADTHQSNWLRFGDSPLVAYLGVPMFLKGDLLGFINVDSRTRGFFNSQHTERLQVFANQAAVAIQNARLYQHAQEIATIEERQRLARELHDAVSQTLFSASVVAETLPRIWEKQKPDELRKALYELNRVTRGAMAEMRTLLAELRPNALLETDLPGLLKHLTDAAAGHIQVPVILETNGQGTLPPDVQIALYRIAQEALNNIIKYARAREVRVTYTYCPDSVSLSIRDDGRGFDLQKPAPGHYGLSIMRERAEAVGAQAEITSQPGMGTEVRVLWQPSPDQES